MMIFSSERELQYTITPIITSLSSSATKIVREIAFQKGSFIPGDRLIIKFKAQVKGNQGNIAHLYFPQEDGIE